MSSDLRVRCSAMAAAGPAVLAGGCATQEARAPLDSVVAFVVLGVDGQPVARAITAAPVCPAIDIDSVTAPAGAAVRSGETASGVRRPARAAATACRRA